MKVLRYLLSQEPDLNVQNNEGNTALHIAAESANKQLCLILIFNGADPSLKNNDGQVSGDSKIEMKVFVNKIYAEKFGDNNIKTSFALLSKRPNSNTKPLSLF